MNWTNVKLIFCREVRDQLRDRRTLFMIFVLPLLLYPLLGMSFFQVAQFVREQPTRVLIIGRSELPTVPPLVEEDDSSADSDEQAQPTSPRICSASRRAPSCCTSSSQTNEAGRVAPCSKGDYEVVVHFPPGFRRAASRSSGNRPSGMRSRQGRRETGGSQPAHLLQHGQRAIDDRLCPRRAACWSAGARRLGRENACSAGHSRADGPAVRSERRATWRRSPAGSGAAVWSKILPFVLLLFGPDRGVLSGGRPVRGREGTRHAGDAAEQPRRAERDRLGQAADGHALQHGHERC